MTAIRRFPVWKSANQVAYSKYKMSGVHTPNPTDVQLVVYVVVKRGVFIQLSWVVRSESKMITLTTVLERT